MTSSGMRDFLPPQTAYQPPGAYNGGITNATGYGYSSAMNGFGTSADHAGHASAYPIPSSSLVGSSHDDLRVMYGRTMQQPAPAPTNTGAEWRLQLAEYASSRLKDEEVMRLQADLRSARSEVERLNGALRQAQARASDELRREQERLGSALRQVLTHSLPS
jgi:hypothetical protein